MAAEWFYTTNKQQMGPVSWEELRQLADIGILKAHDMVWTEGMGEWVKAVNQKGLFSDDGEETAVTAGKKSSYTEAKPPPNRRMRRKEVEEEEDEEEDEKEEKKRKRKRKEERTKMAVGVKVGLILGGVVFFLVLLGCAGGVLAWLSLRGGGGGGPRRENYTIMNLPPQLQDERRFSFTKGRRVTITVTNTLANPNTDVDLYVFRGNNPNPFVVDVQVPQFDRNCRLEFVVPATETYRVRVVNLGPGVANSCNVVIDER